MMNYTEIFNTEMGKINFMLGLIRLAKIDKSVSAEEKGFFTNAAVQLGVSPEGVNALDKIWTEESEILINFQSKPEALLFLREAIQLCSIDNAYDAAEKLEIRKLAQELSVEPEDVDALEVWVSEGMRWRAEGDRLLGFSK